MTLTNNQLMAIGAGVILLGWVLRKQATEAAKAAGQAVNPVNPDNVFYQGTNAVGEALTGDEHFTLGGWIYDKLHGVDG